jgi:3D (Asp-Asp-Asp) domain-containing protein
MDLEEKILRKGIKYFSIWFLCMIFFVWETPKPREWTEEETTYSFVPDEEYQEEKEDWNKVTVTVYNPVTEQCDSTPLITADNSEIDLKKLKQGKLKWVAVSRDLLNSGKVKYGGKVRLKCKDKSLNGVYTVHDTMHPRWEKRVDILAHQDIRTYGKQENVEVEYLD